MTKTKCSASFTSKSWVVFYLSEAGNDQSLTLLQFLLSDEIVHDFSLDLTSQINSWFSNNSILLLIRKSLFKFRNYWNSGQNGAKVMFICFNSEIHGLKQRYQFIASVSSSRRQKFQGSKLTKFNSNSNLNKFLI